MRKVIYPGTFDPITNGHLDIIKRASSIFDHVIVAVARSQEKRPMFDIATRVKMAHIATSDLPNVTIKEFDTLLVNFCQQEDAFIVIRGLRAVSDFEYELQMGYANRSLDKNIETLYLMPSLQNAFISSSVVRTILKYKGNVSHLVPQNIIPYLESR
ncbi:MULTISPECIES: pantetheine-phosphate adenylyltransferase [unclassified Nitratiruptor]|uniref:pantetheine-phosphate adenylyltransferase n=1 Tax=unclassified Nitratiruptor TaxID=2624044 RepID=UPI001915A1BB|nr:MULTISPECIES: pantetheine-phosphate adenylyltransferase [unclassified Nitratiruptor]BCD60460.1 pantetheine-phosphate adenylyltransferase [Nitratiruptor sp. YY08-10]BCD64051.1 pantetheine-phosphate adenylyltransferase [Nitratiruptor sp. YY08-14]